jgi:c-di-GMP-binding flagellar brake protein YcgR
MDQPAPDHPDGVELSPEVLERRRHERRRFRASCFVSIVSRPGFPRARALVNDISAGGIGLVYSRRLETGAPVFVQLEGMPQGPAGLRMARVVHATRRDDGTWVIGCKFVHRLSDAELRQALPEEDAQSWEAEADRG